MSSLVETERCTTIPQGNFWDLISDRSLFLQAVCLQEVLNNPVFRKAVIARRIIDMNGVHAGNLHCFFPEFDPLNGTKSILKMLMVVLLLFLKLIL